MRTWIGVHRAYWVQLMGSSASYVVHVGRSDSVPYNAGGEYSSAVSW